MIDQWKLIPKEIIQETKGVCEGRLTHDMEDVVDLVRKLLLYPLFNYSP
jgi:hypothetical protein